MPNRLKQMLRIGGRSHATGVIHVVQRVVERVLSFHHLFAGKSKWIIRVGNELRDKHHLHMGLWRLFNNEIFHYFPEGALEVCPYLHVPRVKREPKYTGLTGRERSCFNNQHSKLCSFV